jgi:hypothetical protein
VLGGTAGAITIACEQGTPGRVALDTMNVYWTTETPGPIVMKASLTGGAPEPLVHDSTGAFGLALDPTYVYFTQPGAGRVMRVPISGGAAVPMATAVDAPLHLATDGTNLYWTGGKTVGSISKLALSGGAQPVTLLRGLGLPRAIAVDGAFVYWTDFAQGTVLRATTTTSDGGAPVPIQLAYGLKQPSDLTVLGGYAYFPDQAGRVLRVMTSGGLLEELAVLKGAPFGVVSDGAFVYFSTLGVGGIFKAPISGGGPTQTVAGPQADPHFLAVGATAVYWGDWGRGGSIEKAPK